MTPSPSPHRSFQLGGFVLILLLLLLIGLRIWWVNRPVDTDAAAEETVPDSTAVAEVQAFERQRLSDSLLHAKQWEDQRKAWAAERAERAARRAQRAADYQAQKAEWAAERAARETARAERQARYDSLRALSPPKLKAGEFIDANAADTTDFRRIPGIGTGYARAIIGYRERLGGFVHPRQLTEVNGLPADIERWVRIAPKAVVHRIALNRASFSELVRHPYLNYEQVKIIVNLRQKTGPLHSWDELRNSPEFSDEDFQRLAPYFSFDAR